HTRFSRDWSSDVCSSDLFKVRARAARFHDVVKLVRLARVFALLSRQEIHLASAWRKRSGVLTTDTKQHQFGDVAEVEANAAPIQIGRASCRERMYRSVVR